MTVSVDGEGEAEAEALAREREGERVVKEEKQRKEKKKKESDLWFERPDGLYGIDRTSVERDIEANEVRMGFDDV